MVGVLGHRGAFVTSAASYVGSREAERGFRLLLITGARWEGGTVRGQRVREGLLYQGVKKGLVLASCPLAVAFVFVLVFVLVFALVIVLTRLALLVLLLLLMLMLLLLLLLLLLLMLTPLLLPLLLGESKLRRVYPDSPPHSTLSSPPSLSLLA